MRSLIPIRNKRCLSLSLSLLLLCWWCASAQDAEEFFHGGAQRFLTNNIPGALEVVTNGLQRFPEDEKLKKLYELLNQQQQQNQQDQQNQKQDQQKDQQQDKKDDQKQAQKDQQDQKDQQAKNDQQKQEDQKQKEQQDKSGKQDKAKPEEKSGTQQPMEAHAMTPQEAKQLLDAQKGDEQVLIFQPKGEPKNPTKQLKDW